MIKQIQHMILLLPEILNTCWKFFKSNISYYFIGNILKNEEYCKSHLIMLL